MNQDHYATPTPGAHVPGTVLIVEDDPILLRMESRILTRMGFTVIQAADAVTALRLFTEHHSRIRCVMLDQTLPDRPGTWLLRELRALHPDVHVVLCSGLDAADIQGSDAVTFLAKPFSRSQLTRAIEGARDCA